MRADNYTAEKWNSTRVRDKHSKIVNSAKNITTCLGYDDQLISSAVSKALYV